MKILNNCVLCNVQYLINNETNTIVSNIEKFIDTLDLEYNNSQKKSWIDSIEYLKNTFNKLDGYRDIYIAFEYVIPMSCYKRPDIVLFFKDKILILEFKRKDIALDVDKQQLRGYLNEIRNYHEESRNLIVNGCLVVTEGKDFIKSENNIDIVCGNTLYEYLKDMNNDFMDKDYVVKWISSKYKPLLNIIEATRDRFINDSIQEIKNIEEGSLKRTQEFVINSIKNNKSNKNIIFLTGVPGAGKTLVLLNTVYYTNDVSNVDTIFTSGNGPLISVLQNLLSKDKDNLDGSSYIKEIKSIKSSMYDKYKDIPKQGVNLFKTICFDEAQRAWDLKHMEKYKFNKETEIFERFTAKDGIANNTIYGVLVDNNDDIWISTNKGISKINQETNKIENLSVTDGLQGNEFNGNATFKSKSGELFFGGINGLNSFYPEDINKVSKDTKVLFDSFKIDNKAYFDIEGVKFSDKTDSVTIKFFTPIYSSNKNVMYEYRLIGASGEVSTTKDNYVTYNELSPGKYTFEVRVIDTSGNKSEANSVTFTIKPPLWMRPIAIIIYIIVGILFVLRNKYKVIELDNLVNEKTKDLQEEMKKNAVLHNENIKLERNKNSYFVNLSHELRTPLNVINSTNQLIKELSKKNSTIQEEKLNYYIDISQKNCNRLLNLINNILDSSKLEHDMYEITLRETDIVYLVEETSLTLRDYISSKGIELIIDPEVEEKIIICDAYEIERCIINLVSNAAKFTPDGGSIIVSIEDLDDKVKISVQDTGVGIDEKFHKSIFDRFKQASDDGVSKGGSGLGLTITSQIIKLHKGEIYVESKVGEGSNFVIILPVNPNI